MEKSSESTFFFEQNTPTTAVSQKIASHHLQQVAKLVAVNLVSRGEHVIVLTCVLRAV